MKFYPEGRLINTVENIADTHSFATLTEAMRTQKVLEAKAVMCDSRHNLIVDFGFMKGIIPREEGAIGIKEGTTRDIAILSKVNHPVCFIVEGFTDSATDEQPCAILSRRKAQLMCMDDYINKLNTGNVIDVKITHIEQFGVFADIGCGIVSLLPIDSISVSRIEHPSERFQVGMNIRAIVKSKENGRITLTHKELLGTWKENVSLFEAGETVPGIIRSVEPYGIFVELTPNLAGLAEVKENVSSGQIATVYIKSILPERMKVKLIIIDVFPNPKKPPSPPHYYFFGDHMDRFQYSPDESIKQVFSLFST